VPIGTVFAAGLAAEGWLNFRRLRRLEVRSALEEPPVAAGRCG
jgi:hypothetical protein